MTKYIFVTGGVVSSLGKGITAASLGRLLKNRGYKVTIQKFDPYINIDPGTMSPYQHGEVFVTDDGAETDLDLGHYERFIDENLSKASNVTTGKVYQSVINKERKGEYLDPPSRSSRTSPTKSKTESSASAAMTMQTSSSPKSAAPSAISNPCHSSKPSGRSRRTCRTEMTYSTSTSPSCHTSKQQTN